MLIELAEPAPGCLPAEWALAIEATLVVGMISIAAMRKRLRALFWSDVTYAWFGGLMLLTAAFFAHFFVMGVSFSPYGMLTWRWGFPDVLFALPHLIMNLFGCVVWLAAFAAVLVDPPRNTRIQWLIVGTAMVAYPIVLFGTVLWSRAVHPPPGQPPISAVWLTGSFSVLVPLILAAVLLWTRNEKWRNAWFHLLPASLLLLGICWMLFNGLSKGEPLGVLRIGFWMSAAGLSVLFAGSLRQVLARTPPPPGACRTCGYNLTGNISRICPECGTNVGAGNQGSLSVDEEAGPSPD